MFTSALVSDISLFKKLRKGLHSIDKTYYLISTFDNVIHERLEYAIRDILQFVVIRFSEK